MSEGIDLKLIDEIAKSVERKRAAASPAGAMYKRISQVGFYEEGDMQFDQSDLRVGQLYAALSVLCRDALAYEGRPDSKIFDQVTAEVSRADSRRYGDSAFPTYVNLPVDSFPNTLSGIEERGYPDISGLGDSKLVHEWTLKPGKRLQKKFEEKFKETICGAGGPYIQFDKGLLGQEELPKTIAASILTVGFSAATFWYPLAVYIALLIIKAGLKTYCEP